MLEPTPAAEKPVPPAVRPGLRAPDPTLHATLTLGRKRLRQVRQATIARAVLAGFLPLWALALILAADFSWAARIATLLPFAAIGAYLGLGPIWLRIRGHTDEHVARLFSSAHPWLRSQLVSAVQLEAELRKGNPSFSAELAREHIAMATRSAQQVGVERAFPASSVKLAQRILLGCAAVTLILILAFPHRLTGGAIAVWGTKAGSGSAAEKLAEPITYDIELTYVYPAYTGLPSKTVPGTTGEISAPAGTEVHLKTRADRDVAHAELALTDKTIPLQVAGARELSGTLMVSGPGSYRFRFLDAHGAVVAEGPPIPIAVEVDAPPKVELYAPAREIEVDPHGEVVLRYNASDDYGLQSVELVYKVGNAPEQRLPLERLQAGARHAAGDYHWALPPLELAAGDHVTYRVEARDNDTVNGPKLGKTREQILKVYSEAEHHRLALERVQKIWEAMVGQLALTMEAPDRADPEHYVRPDAKKVKDPDPQPKPASPTEYLADVAMAKNVDQKGDQLLDELASAEVDLKKDRAAPQEIPRALRNIDASLRPSSHALAEARGALERWSRSGMPDGAAVTRLQRASTTQIAELEKDSIYLEKLLDHRRIEDLQALAKELSGKRRELSRLLEQYQKAPDAQTKAAIQQEIARLKERIGELMRRMSELARAISDEHMNNDAVREMQKSQDMISSLDKVQQLLNEGKIDEAMKELNKLGDQMDQLQKGLNHAQGNWNQSQDPELAKQFREFNDKLGAVSREQRNLEKEARQLKQQDQADVKKAIDQKGAEFAENLRKKVADAKAKLEKAANAPAAAREGESAQEAMESLEQLDHALQAKDYDAAQEESARALQRAQNLEGDLKYDAVRSRRMPAFSPASPEELDQAADQARQGVQPLAEVKRDLDQLFPKGGQQLSAEQRQKLQQMQKKQEQLGQQQRQLQQQMDEMNKKAPIFNSELKQQMQGAGEQMQESGQSMAQRDPNGSAAYAGDAASQLERFQHGLEKSMQNGGGGGGGGMSLPMPMGDDGEGEEDGSEDGNGMSREHEPVDLEAQKNEGGDAYRKDIMDAMKQGAPARYKDQVKKYYEEIVK
ncbi:MAG: DUF4175 family protein [Deltaproteobacteria bacterium]|nr:DUF4175 family protein [Deltaproteobacteria bacterium]